MGNSKKNAAKSCVPGSPPTCSVVINSIIVSFHLVPYSASCFLKTSLLLIASVLSQVRENRGLFAHFNLDRGNVVVDTRSVMLNSGTIDSDPARRHVGRK